jgi:hypothetical protein
MGMDYLTIQTPKHLLAFLNNWHAGKFSAFICLHADEFCQLRLSSFLGVVTLMYILVAR